MTYRVKVYGPEPSRSHFGTDVYVVDSPADVSDVDGVLLIKTPPTPFVKGEDSPSRKIPDRKATRGSQVCYARGTWTKVVVTDYIDNNNPSL